MAPTDIEWLQVTRFPSDNNSAKAIGGRLSYGYSSFFSVGSSFMTGYYDPNELLQYTTLGFDASADVDTKHGRLQLSGEYAVMPTDYAAYNDTATKIINIGNYVTSGWYAMAVFQFAKKYEAVAVYDVLTRDGPEVQEHRARLRSPQAGPCHRC